MHPASILFCWLALLCATGAASAAQLVAPSIVFIVAARLWAEKLWYVLLRRSRWLLATVAITFAWMTPATTPDQEIFLALGMSREGLYLAADHIARLLLALATLALISTRLDAQRWVVGLRGLLTPLRWLHGPHDTLAVRLMLTLQEVEGVRGQPLCGDAQLDRVSIDEAACEPVADRLSLPVYAASWRDYALCGGAGLLAIASMLL